MKKYTLYIIVALFMVYGCETIITLDLPDPKQQIVVEGSIETGQPPIVILTNSIPFYGETDLAALQNLYVRDAVVTVSNGEASVELLEICLDDIPEDLQPLVAEFFGIDADSLANIGFNICIYTDPGLLLGTPTIIGEDGKSYDLTIESNGEILTSTTTIPVAVPLDSLFYEPHPDPGAADSLVQLYGHLSDPPALGNYYRLFVSRNSGGYQADFFSVIDDLVFNGLSLDFNITRIPEDDEDFSDDTYGYFYRGDTVSVKLSSIDQASFNFWNTLENDSGGDGPFSSVTIVDTNIEGGQGIWCGYGSAPTTIIIE